MRYFLALVLIVAVGGVGLAADKPAGPSCEAKLEVAHTYIDELRKVRDQSEATVVSLNITLNKERAARQALEKKVAEFEKKSKEAEPQK